jgi:hypothetical protein
MFRSLYATIILGASLFAPTLLAQTDATVSGTVLDPAGASVIGAIVTAVNVETGVTTPTTSNSSGVYVFPSLAPGRYRITTERSGFRKEITNVDLAVGAKITVNVALTLGQVTESIEVATTVTEVNASSATIGNVLESRKILELPLVGRSSYDLLATQPGVIVIGTNAVNLNGSQTGAINYTTDGINTQDNLLNGAANTNYANMASIDRVEEFRVVTSPADAEYGRGSGQVQLITRGGTNRYVGSAWEELRNTALNANDWFNNQAGTNPVTGLQQAPRNILVRNQFGLRFGGPVRKNKTFFHGIWEEDLKNQKNSVNRLVYTPTALQGIFRYFPGSLNGNAAAIVPTVNTSGTPVQPPTATGSLQSVSVFGRDPNRLVPDPTGTVTKYLSLMPLPNNYLIGDGLNTAGFQWAQPFIQHTQLFEGRIDHNFNEKHRLTITLNHQSWFSNNAGSPQPFPTSPVGLAPAETTQYSVAVTSALRPNLLNEFRFGVFRPRTIVWAEFDPDAGPTGVIGQGLLPKANGVPYYLTTTSNITSPISAGTTSNRMTQNWQYGDDITWIKGRHSFKGGAQIRYIANDGYDTVGVVPSATIGAGAVGAQNINTFTGIGSNATVAQNLLLDLTGSLSLASAVLNSPGGPNPQFIPGESRYSDLLTREYDGYFKDDFKVTPSLTLNLGVRYEWYGVPFDGKGRAVALAGGQAGIFGISGTNFGALFQPGASGGSLTQVQLIGPGTPHPDTKLYNNDNNNFAPAMGLAWSLPGGHWSWLSGGRDKTVLRAGYGISYQRDQIYLAHMSNSYQPNGLAVTTTEQSATLLNVQNLALPIPTTATPVSVEPLNGPRLQAAYSFQDNLVNPYIQNYNFSIQRAMSPSTSLTVSYVGSSGSKLVRSYDLNEINILAQAPNGETFLQAFKTVQAGGTSPLMDSFAPLGLNSTTMRTSPLFSSFFSNNNPAGLAALLNGSSLTAGVGGALLTKAGLPQNFFVVNPQFAPTPFGSAANAFGGAYTVDNSGHSTYNSLVIQVNRRFTRGFSLQGSYVWSKGLGDGDAGENATFYGDFRTLRNRGLDKRLLAFNHAGVFKLNSIYELPFGPGKLFARNSKGIFAQTFGGWQLGGIFTVESGAPITILGVNGLNNSQANGNGLSTATQVGALPAGAVSFIGNGVTYFNGLKQVTDPYVANITTLGNLQGLSTLKAIAGPDGTPILVNAQPGQLGSLAGSAATGPGILQLDVNLIKRFKINERFSMQIGGTAENILNHENFAAPSLNINSATFGRISATAVGFTPRIIVLQARLNF